ncbi:hypothetical protein [Rhodanobacter denitrificans]|uniref:hypothetical protein n=1 Tax=Rhodanobacter denitrificans TaxID=666685 RepID=UPI0011C07E80|nr:hypothetical protein [Rhodanobacter denitrificans]
MNELLTQFASELNRAYDRQKGCDEIWNNGLTLIVTQGIRWAHGCVRVWDNRIVVNQDRVLRPDLVAWMINPIRDICVVMTIGGEAVYNAAMI